MLLIKYLNIQSARVDGNPWVLYSEERYQKFLAFLEEVLLHNFFAHFWSFLEEVLLYT